MKKSVFSPRQGGARPQGREVSKKKKKGQREDFWPGGASKVTKRKGARRTNRFVRNEIDTSTGWSNITPAGKKGRKRNWDKSRYLTVKKKKSQKQGNQHATAKGVVEAHFSNSRNSA